LKSTVAFQPPRLGPGATYLRSIDDLFRSNADLIKVAEIEPQTLWTKGTTPGSLPRSSPVEMRGLSALPQRLLTHGVGYPIGGTICDQERHVGEFRLWTEELASLWTSEHLSILDVPGARGSQHCGFLMPPLQTDVGAKLAAKNIMHRAAAIGRPFAFETGVNYFVPRDCEMPDGEFFAAIAEAADCGILLDLTNLWVNDRNGRAKIGDVLAKLPLERVWEVHLAGIEFAHGYCLDAHSRGIDPDLAGIAAEIVPCLPNLGAIIFEIALDRVSGFGATAFLREIEMLHRLWDTTPRVAAMPLLAAGPFTGPTAPTPEAWERVIADRMLPASDRPTPASASMQIRTADERSFSLYMRLAASFRAGTIAELLKNTTRLLLIAIGEEALRDLLDRYISVTLPFAFPTDEALSFRRYLDANPIPVPGLEEMLKFEATLIEAAANNLTIQVTVEKDLDAMLGDIAVGRLPGPSSDRPTTVLEIGVDPAPFVRVLEGQSVEVDAAKHVGF
jgi:uncharacterized protein (UPF0276 family)